MNYHDIKHDDMNNGPGLRVTLFVSGCDHYCNGCQNPETWDTKSGIPFDNTAIEEIFKQLDNDYISGITFSGGDPLNENNRVEVCSLISKIKSRYGNSKSIWIYTGYTWNEIIEEAFPIFNRYFVKYKCNCRRYVSERFGRCKLSLGWIN